MPRSNHPTIESMTIGNFDELASLERLVNAKVPCVKIDGYRAPIVVRKPFAALVKLYELEKKWETSDLTVAEDQVFQLPEGCPLTSGNFETIIYEIAELGSKHKNEQGLSANYFRYSIPETPDSCETGEHLSLSLPVKAAIKCAMLKYALCSKRCEVAYNATILHETRANKEYFYVELPSESSSESVSRNTGIDASAIKRCNLHGRDYVRIEGDSVGRFLNMEPVRRASRTSATAVTRINTPGTENPPNSQAL